jgi:hypothetical protein
MEGEVGGPMRRSFVDAPLAGLLVLFSLPAALRAQATQSPVKHALYLALGGDPTAGDGPLSVPFAMSAGVERTRSGSRWTVRLGADYRRQSSNDLGRARWEDFGVSVTTRYGRASGPIRPYVLGGLGIVDQRTRVRDAVFYADPGGILFPPHSFDYSSWTGALVTGIGSDFTLGRVRLFTEARFNLHPLSILGLSRGVNTNKALYVGIRL